MKATLLFFFFFLSHASWSQQNRYMVFFNGKEGSTYSIDQPQEFLTERSLVRRLAQNIEVTIEDLPVNEHYVAQIKAMGVPVYHRSRWLNAVLVEDTPEKVEALASLAFVKRIEYVAPGKKLGARSLAGSKQAPNAAPLQHELLDIPLMHRLGYTGRGKMIAVLDDGFAGVQQSDKFDHLFRNKQLLHTKDFVGNSSDVFRYDDHGTKSLSTIAVVDSGTFIGTAPESFFLLAVTEDEGSEYIIEEYNWLMASEWADSLGADIITSSLGYGNYFQDPAMNHKKAVLDGKTTVAARAAVWATERGMLVVNSAGNSRYDEWGTITTPADADNILAVGAVDAAGHVATFSSPGPSADGRIKPDVVALGVNTIVVGASGNYQSGSGTSFAGPQIAGLAAGVWQAFPELTNLQLRELIIRSANIFLSPDNDLGFGVPSFQRIYQPAALEDGLEQLQVQLYPNPLSASSSILHLKITPVAAKPLELMIWDTSGSLITKVLVDPDTTADYELDISKLLPGFYVLQIVHQKGISKHKFLRL